MLLRKIARVQHVDDHVTIKLNATNAHLRLIRLQALLLLGLQLCEDLVDRSCYDAIAFTLHSMRLSGTGLAIREYTNLITVKDCRDEIADRSVDVLLRAVRSEDFVITEELAALLVAVCRGIE